MGNHTLDASNAETLVDEVTRALRAAGIGIEFVAPRPETLLLVGVPDE